ncbi:hypothetical protein B0J13DRAFT_676988 [Dactylonectria estremocensis]|uniref:RRM domain-containing protein n=1 Tax=Dactylonectria estremocensis TaxID=1079267 RepID=A0A9P9EMJ2_9HYPO|nr:hypothetical protein B0J13DRAFT_676988 [Dactylonectria estremocensis]
MTTPTKPSQVTPSPEPCVKPSTEMAPYNARWEAQIEVYRKKCLLLVRVINWSATRDQFEADVRGKLTKPDTITFLWPPMPAHYTNPQSHQGWIMLAFSGRPDVATALVDLDNYEFRGRRPRIDRAKRRVYAPAPATGGLSIPPAVVPPPVPGVTMAGSTTICLTWMQVRTLLRDGSLPGHPYSLVVADVVSTAVPIAAATAPITAAVCLPAQPTSTHDTATRNSSGSDPSPESTMEPGRLQHLVALKIYFARPCETGV